MGLSLVGSCRPSLQALLALPLCVACSGIVVNRDVPGQPPGSVTEPRPPGSSGCNGQETPGPVALRRLTTGELSASLRALFGPLEKLPTPDLPPDGAIDGFTNNVEALAVSSLHVRQLRTFAESMGVTVASSDVRRKALVGCDDPSSAACFTEFVQRFGRRAFRRPLSPEEQGGLIAIGGDRSHPIDAVARVVSAVLQAPSFLYRLEDGGAPDGRGWRKLDGYVIASRLSFWLTQAPPDDALLDAAAKGDLDSADGVRAAARRLLGTPAAAPAWSAFVAEWLRLSDMDGMKLDARRYPDWGDELRAELRAEVLRFAGDFVRPGSDFARLYDAGYSYPGPTVAAKVYGRAAPAAYAKVAFTAEDARAGLLTLPGVLAATGRDEGVWPILRGKFVRDSLLCDPPPPPPPDIPALPAARTGESLRSRLARHRIDAACNGCHEAMDPIGFGLEQYDLIGRLRTTDEDGKPLTGEGRIAEWAPEAFKGGVELGARLAASTEPLACFARQTFRYAFGTHEEMSDECTLTGVAAAFASGNRDLGALVDAMVTSDRFRFVRRAR